MSDTFTMTEQNPRNRAYIVKRKTGWYAVSTKRVDDRTEETTTIGPMSREDAALARDSMKSTAKSCTALEPTI